MLIKTMWELNGCMQPVESMMCSHKNWNLTYSSARVLFYTIPPFSMSSCKWNLWGGVMDSKWPWRMPRGSRGDDAVSASHWRQIQIIKNLLPMTQDSKTVGEGTNMYPRIDRNATEVDWALRVNFTLDLLWTHTAVASYLWPLRHILVSIL